MLQPFDELAWVMSFFNNAVDLKTEGIERVSNFVFLWNMFETFACHREANLNSIKQIVEEINTHESFDLAVFAPFVSYFSNRYFNPDGSTTHSIEGLKLRVSRPSEQAAKAEIIAVLQGNETRPKEVVRALLIICFRFRNNLFHGNKAIIELDNQIDNFIVANNILSIVLTIMKRNHMIS